MSDTRDYFRAYDDEPEDDGTVAEHHPDLVLADLDEEGMTAEPMEWQVEDGFGTIQMACGCIVDVRPGDIVWMMTGTFTGAKYPVAIEPVTIH